MNWKTPPSALDPAGQCRARGFATGALLLAVPAVVTELLLGSAAEGQESVLARLLGGGLISLGVTGLLAGNPPAGRGAVIGFAVYNGATTAVLGVAGALGTGRTGVNSCGRS